MSDSTDTPLEALRRSVPQVGTVTWIGRAPAKRAPIETLESVEIEVGTGLVGEHHAQSGTGKRQVTLLQAEHLPVIAALLGRDSCDPADLRRNVVVAGINLWGLRTERFLLGDVLLEGTGPCPPCSRMEEILGPGGYHAARGHGGITARVITGGLVRRGDAVRIAPPE